MGGKGLVVVSHNWWDTWNESAWRTFDEIVVDKRKPFFTFMKNASRYLLYITLHSPSCHVLSCALPKISRTIYLPHVFANAVDNIDTSGRFISIDIYKLPFDLFVLRIFFFFYAINCVCSVHRCLFYVKDERNDCSSQQSTFVRFFVGCELSTESGMRLTSCLMAEITNWLPLMSTADVNHRISTVKFLEGSMIRVWWRHCLWANNLSGTPNGVTAVLCVCERQCSCSCIWQTVNVQRILAVIDGGVCLSSSYARNVYTQAIYPCFDMRMWKAYKWNTSHGCSCVFPTLTYAIHTA